MLSNHKPEEFFYSIYPINRAAIFTILIERDYN